MSHSIEQYLLHAALLCSLGPSSNSAYRLQLFLVANRDLASRNHQNDFQRAIETAVDSKRLFTNIGGKGSGEYALTAGGCGAAVDQFGVVSAAYAPASKEFFKATIRGTVGKMAVKIVTRGTKSIVFFGNERIRSAKEACLRLEASAGLHLPTQNDSAVRVLQDFSIDRGFEIDFQ